MRSAARTAAGVSGADTSHTSACFPPLRCTWDDKPSQNPSCPSPNTLVVMNFPPSNLHPIIPDIPDSWRGKGKWRQGSGLGTGPLLPPRGVFSYLKLIRFGQNASFQSTSVLSFPSSHGGKGAAGGSSGGRGDEGRLRDVRSHSVPRAIPARCKAQMAPFHLTSLFNLT